jgi:hypothetical protein
VPVIAGVLVWNSEQQGWKFHNRDGWLSGMNNRRIAKRKEA